MDWLKKLAIIGDLEDVVVSGFALAHMASDAIQPPFDVLKTHVETFMSFPSFAMGSTIVTDAGAVVTAAETALGSTTMEVIAFKSALAALKLDIGV